MKAKKILRRLRASLDDGHLVDVERRRFSSGEDLGAVVGLSDDWVVLARLDPDLLTWDGFRALRLADVDAVRTLDDSFVPRALELLGEPPFDRERGARIRVESVEELLRSTRSVVPVVMLECEENDDGAAYPGRIEELDAHRVVLAYIPPSGRLDGREEFRLDAITSITVGGRYLRGLWLVAAEDTRPRA